MYDFVEKSVVQEADEWCRQIINEVQKEVSDYFTFDFRLIGSGEKRLVMHNGDKPFDLDYNFYLQRDFYELATKPQEIKKIFSGALRNVLNRNKTRNVKIKVDNSTSVLTSKIIINNELNFSFDVAIMVRLNDGYLYKLIYDKNTNHYIWNKVPNSKNYENKFKAIKKSGLWCDFKNRYKTKKNNYLRQQKDIPSFSIFLEILNEYNYE